MIYYHEARFDGLAKRHETLLELTDYFVKRDDFLEYRKTIFEHRPKRFGPADKDTQRPIIVIFHRLIRTSFSCFSSFQSITERYGRNSQIDANEDIQEMIYDIKDNRFILTYHRNNVHITPSTRYVRLEIIPSHQLSSLLERTTNP